jgi:NDP-sugar pyrophosphorylase family protein
LINKPLILHTIEQLGGEVEVLLALGDEELKSFLEEHQITFSDDLTKLREASQLIPGDILLTEKEAGEGILTVDEGSEETEMLQKLLTEEGIEKPTTIIDSALRINYPWEILTANTLLSKTIPDDIDPSATIEEGVTIKGNVAIGKNTIVKAGSYIEGPVIIGDDCLIGPMAHLRPETALGNGVTIGKTEVYDVVIMSKSVSKHHAYVAHSVLGRGCQCWCLLCHSRLSARRARTPCLCQR